MTPDAFTDYEATMAASPVTADALVAEARKWIGAPYQHKGRTKEGVDCWGLIWSLRRDLIGPAPDFTGYDAHLSVASCRALVAKLDTLTVRVPILLHPLKRKTPMPGLIAVFRSPETISHHLGVTAVDRRGRLTVIHADDDAGVVENRLIANFAEDLSGVRVFTPAEA